MKSQDSTNQQKSQTAAINEALFSGKNVLIWGPARQGMSEASNLPSLLNYAGREITIEEAGELKCEALPAAGTERKQ